MAKIHRPLNSEKARGAIGDIIFSESNNVNYVRRNTVRPYEKTEARKEMASRLNSAATAWSRLTPETKKAWEDFAESTAAWNAFGEQFTKPAFSWFVGCRENLHSIRRYVNPNIAGAEFPETPTNITYDPPAIWSTQLQIFVAHETSSNKWAPRVYISNEKSPSRIFNISECHLLKPDNITGSILKINMTTAEYNQFKGVYTLFAQLVDRDSGLAGELYKQRVEFT